MKDRSFYRGQPPFRFQYLVRGFHLLVISWVLKIFFPAQGFSAEKIFISMIFLSAVICFSLQILIVKNKFSKISEGAKILTAGLFLYFLICIVRGITSDVTQLFTLLANPGLGGTVWLLPFAIYIGRQPGALFSLLPVFKIHTIASIILCFTTIFLVVYVGEHPNQNITRVGVYLGYGAPIVLLAGLGNRSDWRLSFLGAFVICVTHAVLTDRANFLLSLLVLIFSVTLRDTRNIKKIRFRVLFIIFGGGVVFIYLASYILASLSDEWLTDTRTFLWVEMYDDFSSFDWIFGRGALGTYYSPYFDYTSSAGLEGDSAFRQVNEIGYLHIALKAGVIGVILYVSILIFAIIKSLKFPEKRMGIGMGLIMFFHLLELSIVGQANFYPERVMLWIMVGMAISVTALKK